MPSAPLTVADTLVLPGLAFTARTAATRTFGRRPDEVPAARRFIREALNGHPAAFDAELLACELVTNTVQHATDADWVTIAVSRRGATVHVDVMDDGQTGLPHWRETTGGGRGRPRLPARQRHRAALGVPPRARPHLRLVRARPRGLLASPDSR